MSTYSTYLFDDPFFELFFAVLFPRSINVSCLKQRKYTMRFYKPDRQALFIFSFIRLSIKGGTKPPISPPRWKISFTSRELTYV